MMYTTSRRTILLAALILLLVLLFALTRTNVVSLAETEGLSDGTDNVSVTAVLPVVWIRIPVYPLFMVLMLGISIFASVLVYLGGRSKVKRFNDRTIDLFESFVDISSQTALLFRRAVFNFVFSNLFLPQPGKTYISGGTKP
jgi:hypothetical protein